MHRGRWHEKQGGQESAVIFIWISLQNFLASGAV
jgi:hypothetical protein